MSEHTSGLLRTSPSARKSMDIVTDAKRSVIVASVHGRHTHDGANPIPFEVALANARRLVACWNALDGLDTEVIESGAVLGSALEYNRLRAVNAELLAACWAARDTIDRMSGNDLALGNDEPALSMLNAAIANAEKASQS